MRPSTSLEQIPSGGSSPLGEADSSTSGDGGSSTLSDRAERSSLVRSVVKAFSILETIAAAPDGMALGELSREDDLHPSTAHRLLHTLVELGYVQQDPRTRRYLVGARATDLAQPVRRHGERARLAQPLLARLSETVNETVNLLVLDGDTAIHLARSVPQAAVRMASSWGARLPLYCTAGGKALLANLEPALQEQLLSTIVLSRRTPNTITQLDDLRVELDRIRRRGYAVDDEEQELGVRCVAAAVLANGPDMLAAVSVSGPSGRVSVHRLAELARLVGETAGAIALAWESAADRAALPV